MREILFRGKTKDGNWVVGSHFCMQHNDERTHVHHFIIPDGAPIPKDKPIGEIQVEVMPESVGQYIGVTDRNHKPVFEGDICRARDSQDKEDIYLVCEYGYIKRKMVKQGPWINTEMINLVEIPCFYFRNVKTGENLFPCDDPELGRDIIFPVAGNIIDNPELLAVE